MLFLTTNNYTVMSKLEVVTKVMTVEQIKIILNTMIRELVPGSNKFSYNELMKEVAPVIENILTRCVDTNIIFADQEVDKAHTLCIDTNEVFVQNSMNDPDAILRDNMLTRTALKKFIENLDNKDLPKEVLMYENGNPEEPGDSIVSLLDEVSSCEVKDELSYLFDVLIDKGCMAVRRLVLIDCVCEYANTIESDPSTIRHTVMEKFNSLEHSLSESEYTINMINSFCEDVAEEKYTEAISKLKQRYCKIGSIILDIECANKIIPFLKALTKY